jgi:hypothetical protein
LIAVVSLMAAMSTMALSPALAAPGFFQVSRIIELTGDRDFVRTDFRVVDSAPSGTFELSFQFPFRSEEDPGGSINVRLTQEGADNGSRLLTVDSYGLFNHVNGPNCVPGDFYSSCRRGGYDWVKLREYRVVLDRGDHNDDGWLWTMKLVDMETGDTTKLISLRTSYARLAPSRSHAMIQVLPNDCTSINRFGANVQKPEVHDGTTVSWGDVDKLNDCEGATLTAAVEGGTLKLRIDQ